MSDVQNNQSEAKEGNVYILKLTRLGKGQLKNDVKMCRRLVEK